MRNNTSSASSRIFGMSWWPEHRDGNPRSSITFSVQGWKRRRHRVPALFYTVTRAAMQVSSSVHAGQGLNLMIWILSHSHPFMKGSNARGHTQGLLMLREWEIIHQFNADISYVDGIFYSRSHTCKHRARASNSHCIYSGDVPSKILHSFSVLQMPQMWGQGCFSPKKGWRCVTRV